MMTSFYSQVAWGHAGGGVVEFPPEFPNQESPPQQDLEVQPTLTSLPQYQSLCVEFV